MRAMFSGIFVLAVLQSNPIALPGGPPVVMDYLAFDAATGRVWVPAGNTGRVDVVDVATGKVTAVDGFPTAPSPRAGRPPMGPSSATVGDGVIWVGNRADKKLCAIDARTHERRTCVQLASMPDGLAWVAATHELWATTPRDQTLTIVRVDGNTPAAPATLKLEGEPEGYAVDAARGIFYTNLEDKDRTLAIDVRTRKVLASFAPGCGEEGPRGLALDAARRLLLVACTDGAVALDLAHDGRVAGRLKTGAGVDNIDYAPGRKLLYVASGKTATLTLARVGDGGALEAVATAPTATGARVVISDASGKAWVADSNGGRLIAVMPPAP
jgi:DNA-binding beta-propeller fold protein YncE